MLGFRQAGGCRGSGTASATARKADRSRAGTPLDSTTIRFATLPSFWTVKLIVTNSGSLNPASNGRRQLAKSARLTEASYQPNSEISPLAWTPPPESPTRSGAGVAGADGVGGAGLGASFLGLGSARWLNSTSPAALVGSGSGSGSRRGCGGCGSGTTAGVGWAGAAEGSSTSATSSAKIALSRKSSLKFGR